MGKSTRPNSTTKPIAKLGTKRTGKAAKIHPPQPETPAPCICLPDPTGLPDGCTVQIVDGEWMVLYPGSEGQHPVVGPGGGLIYVD